MPLGGFLGAGKTTTMLAAARRFEQRGERVSVITNDQGVDLVDTQLARASQVDADEVTGGCFCCRFEDLSAVVDRVIAEVRPTVIIAEAVGSCTDLQSTVVRPLRHFYGDSLRIAPLVVVVDPIRYRSLSRLWTAGVPESDLAYLYRHQLDEADVIALNKVDLLRPTDRTRLRDDVNRRFGRARVVELSARTGEGLDPLLDVWSTGSPVTGRPFDVDYDRYAAAEAELAWTNQTVELSAAGGFSARGWVERFLAEISRSTAASGATVGHVKVRVSTSGGDAVKASLTEAGGAPDLDEPGADAATGATATINARVQATPEELDRLIAAATAAADAEVGTTSGPRSGEVFRPGFPLPVHRM